jgi:cell division protein FtsI (penicillin-binding protein 3)
MPVKQMVVSDDSAPPAPGAPLTQSEVKRLSTSPGVKKMTISANPKNHPGVER